MTCVATNQNHISILTQQKALKMSKIRLNAEMRKELIKYSQELISFPEDEAKLEEAYRIAQGAAREVLARRYPAADMLVLAKYDAARQQDDFKFCVSSYDFTYFDFKKGTGPLARQSYNAIGCNTEEFNKIDSYQKAIKDLSKKRRELETDYENLIKAARTFEELTEIWPEAEVMRDSIEGRAGKRAISTLSVEAIERIKSDVAKRIA